MVKTLSSTLAKPRSAKTHASRRSIGRAGIRAVAIGGGTGLFHPASRVLAPPCCVSRATVGRATPPSVACPIADLTAVVTVTDDGGSRAVCAATSTCCRPAICATAWSRSLKMSASSPGSFATASATGGGLEGHSFGNLFVAAGIVNDRGLRPGGSNSLLKYSPTRGSHLPRNQRQCLPLPRAWTTVPWYTERPTSRPAGSASLNSCWSRPTPNRCPRPWRPSNAPTLLLLALARCSPVPHHQPSGQRRFRGAGFPLGSCPGFHLQPDDARQMKA